jgi:hypothetical protein
VAVAAGLAGNAAQAGAVACTVRPGEKVLARSSEALVVEARGDTFACLRKGGRRYRLNVGGGDVTPPVDVGGRPLLSGKFVLYKDLERADFQSFLSLSLVDLRTGTQVALVGLGGTVETPTSVRGMVLKRNGSFAWIQDQRPDGGTDPRIRTVNTCPVRTCPRRDTPDQTEVKDEGTGIVPGSLTLHGSRISWIKDGQRRSARL